MKWNQRLTQAREAKKLSKSALGRLLKISAPTITHWESGEIEHIKAENLMKLCEVLDVTEAWLMNGEGAPRQRTRTFAGSLSLKAETDEEMELLTSFRLANAIERNAFSGAVETVFARIEAAGRNKA